ncbi:NosR/NirI family transcriptional regulator, nitrous oxide reductase regulator [Marinobacter persicus]|uniref:NosR/NirI family transcriptional regulator, nitrous oxide reductase regulator n=2 Tax=Marinobacter persicus TaxID=930118 RepID=A0A1I3P500_9GAMM|nr:regulatory protein NosR [Marinobacter persicus]SFJ16407.1 NosR/NirI family transcriptional regulator, nitrous oxide reductase regulator [Marinobacter persicus]
MTLVVRILLLCLLMGGFSATALQAAPVSGYEPVAGRQVIEKTFPEVTRYQPLEENRAIQALYAGEKLKGYVYQSLDFVQTPAYSGKPVNAVVVLDPEGKIRAARVIEHHEPILLVGIPERKLHEFTDQYVGLKADQKVTVGGTSNERKVAVDGVSGATVTVMVINEVLMRTAHRVGVELGVIEGGASSRPPMAQIRSDGFQPRTWEELTGNGAVRRLRLTRGQVDDAFLGTPAEGIDEASQAEREDTLIDLYATYLDVPTIGRNLLGENQYRRLKAELKPGEHAIAVMANGDYSFKGSGYVRGGIFDRIQIRQFGDTFNFRDLDYYRLSDVYAEGMPDFNEMAIFIIRQQYNFDPGTPWTLELTVKRQTGPLDSEFQVFPLEYQLPDTYYTRPEPVVTEEEWLESQPMWVQVWYQKQFQITVLGVGIAVLLFILFFQDWLVRKPRMMRWIRHGFLVYTLVFIGWYALGQLSIVNVLTFVNSLISGFSWETFLIDPIIFVLWAVVAGIVLLWGRAVYCGWLCPFGALQELLNEIARKLKIPQYTVPFAWHERLWAIKYIILLVLFGVSLEAMGTAEQMAEVEPFKTAITLHFARSWPFVLYAVALLVVNLFTRKVYCRYLCPLGAALALPTKLRVFDWLKRRKECGNPCRLCDKECEVQAIHPDGRINYMECHYCLDCQMTYFDDHKCPPLIVKRRGKRRGHNAPGHPEQIPVAQVE